MQQHTHTNFTISLPTTFERQPQKGYSDSFLFKSGKAFLSFQCVVSTNVTLQSMADVAVMDLIFRSSADYPRHYTGFRAGEGADRWISFTKGRGSFAARFRIVKRETFPVAKAVGAEIVFYEIQREAEGSWADEQGRSVPAPMKISPAVAFVIDTGERKYVFRSMPSKNEEALESLRRAMATFEAAPSPGPYPRKAADGLPVNGQE
jgi:hypothetical protein